jgi:hypothetical protein
MAMGESARLQGKLCRLPKNSINEPVTHSNISLNLGNNAIENLQTCFFYHNPSKDLSQ